MKFKVIWRMFSFCKGVSECRVLVNSFYYFVIFYWYESRQTKDYSPAALKHIWKRLWNARSCSCSHQTLHLIMRNRIECYYCNTLRNFLRNHLLFFGFGYCFIYSIMPRDSCGTYLKVSFRYDFFINRLFCHLIK